MHCIGRVDVIQEVTLWQILSRIDVLRGDGQILVQIQRHRVAVEDNPVGEGNHLTRPVYRLALVVDEVILKAGGSAAPGHSGDGELLAGMLSVDVHILNRRTFIGVVDTLCTSTFLGSLQIGIETQGYFVVGDVADIPDELLHTTGVLGIGEVLGCDGHRTVGVGGHDVCGFTQDTGISLRTVFVKGNSLHHGAVALPGADQTVVACLRFGVQVVRSDINGRRLGNGGAKAGGLQREIAVDGIGDLGIGTGALDFRSKICKNRL